MKKRILAWFLIISLMIGSSLLGGCGNGNQETGNGEMGESGNFSRPNTSTNERPETAPIITLTGMTGFTESESAMVTFTREIKVYSEENPEEEPKIISTNYYGLVNAKGKVYYCFTPSPDFTYFISDFGDDHVLILKVGRYANVITGQKETYYTVVDSDGKVTFSSAERNDFDSVLCYGENKFMVYKDTSNIQKAEHSYGVLDHNGNWIAPLAPGPYEPVSYMNEEFLNDELIVSYPNNKSSYHYYNYKLNRWYTVDNTESGYGSDDYMFFSAFHNGVLYIKTPVVFKNSDYVTLTVLGEETQNLSRYCKVLSDGKWEEITENEFQKKYYAYGEIVTKREADRQEYLNFVDHIHQTTTVYKDFNCNSIDNEYDLSGRMTSQYVIVKVLGADRRYYHVLLNNKGESQFDPIPSTTCEFIDEDRLLFSNGTYCQVTDLQGKVIISFDRGCAEMSKYYFGYLYAKKDNGFYEVYNKSGAVVVSASNKLVWIGRAAPSGTSPVKNENKKYFLIDKQGKSIDIVVSEKLFS